MTDDERKALLSNTLLTNNLQFYLMRYPEDQKRIFDLVLRKLDKPPRIDGFEVSPPSTDYRARLCFIVGMMSPKLWQETQDLWKSDAYFIVESNPDAVAHAFQTIELQHYLMNPGYHFYLGYQGDDLIAPMQRMLRQTAYAGKLYLSQVLAPNTSEGIDQKYVDYAKDFNQLLRKTVDHVYFNFGNINDSIEGLRASFQNLDRIKQSGGVTELENLHKDKPIVVVGAGPSLDADIELLALNQDKFIIVAVDAAVKPLLGAGCRVDYAVTIERYQGGLQEEFFIGLPSDLQTELVVYPVVHKDVIEKWPGTVRFVYRNYAWYAYFEKSWPMGILESGGSASHLATKLALHMGASKVYLIGCDMTYEKHNTDNTWRSHCKSTAFPDWNAYRTEAEIAAKKDFCGFYDVVSNDGSLSKTHTIYHQWAKEYASLIVSSRCEGRLVSTAAKGIRTPGLEYLPLNTVVSSLESINWQEKMHPPNWRRMDRDADLTDLLESVEGILKTFKTADAALCLLIDNPDLKRPDILKQANDSLYAKLAGDTFFTAFIIQNCAMEFFKTEAKVYAVPEGPMDDDNYGRRLWALHQLYQVLIDIGQKTVNVIELASKGEL